MRYLQCDDFPSSLYYPPSIVMTTCSNIAALGLMPLLLYIFSQGFTGLENAVPYAGILTALAFTLVPCAFGIAINHFKPNTAVTVKKVRLPHSDTCHRMTRFKQVSQQMFRFIRAVVLINC